MSKIRTIAIFSFIFLVLLGIFYYIGLKHSYSKLAVDLFFNSINNKINGKLIAENPILRFKGRYLNAHAESIELRDNEGNLLLKANDLNILWSFTNLINPGQNFKKVEAGRVMFNASRNTEGVWNYQKLLKEQLKKKVKYKVENLKLPWLDLKIEDDLTQSDIEFKKMSLFYRSSRFKDIFRLRSDKSIWQGELSGMHSNDIADLSDSEYSNLIDIDSIVESKVLFAQKNEKHKIRIINLDPINIQLLLSIIDFGDHPNLKAFLNKYTKTTKLTVISDLQPEENYKKANFRIVIKDLVDIPELLISSSLNLSADLTLNKFKIAFNDTVLSLKGKIENWKNNNPFIALDAELSNLNIREMKNSFIELDKLVPDFLLNMMNSLGLGDNLNGQVKLSSKLKEPILKIELPVFDDKSGEQKSIRSVLHYSKEKILIKEANIPMDFSHIKMDGQYFLDKASYNLNLKAVDLPIARLRNLFVHLPVLHDYQSFLITPILSGYSSFDLNIKPESIRGNIKLAKGNYISQSIPVRFRDLTVDLDVLDSKLIFNMLSSRINNDQVEGRATLELNKDFSKIKYNAEIASPSFHTKTLEKSGLLNFDAKTKLLSNLDGVIRDFYLDLKKDEEYSFSGKMKLDQVSFIYDQDHNFNNISGTLLANNKGYLFEDLSISLNESKLKLTGRSDRLFKEAKLSVIGSNIDFAELAKLLHAREKFGFAANSGMMNLNLNLNGDSLLGNGSVSDASFILQDFEKIKYPFLNITSDFHLSDNLKFKNLSGKYGSTSFSDSLLEIKNYKSDDKSFVIDLNGNIVISEFEELIPESISKFMDAKGALPVELSASGDAKKSHFDVVARVDQIESYSFADWLEINKNFEVTAKTKFIVTPQLIFSEAATIESKLGDKKAVLDLGFQIQDWKEKDDALVKFDSSTLNGGTQRVNLGLIVPHIVSLRPLNLDVGMGTMDCETRSNNASRQTVCLFFADDAIAHKYGIGDLNAKDLRIDLVSATDRPLDLKVRLKNGNWNGIDYNKVKLDLKVFLDSLEVNNINANLPNYGTVRGTTTFNFKTLESTFFLRGNRLSANQLIDGVWGFGSEVPEGYVSGIFEGKTKGLLPDEMFFNLVGDTQLIVRDGKLSSLKTMQKILSAVNTLKNFDFNNVFQTLITYKGGLFNYAISRLHYDHGKVSSEKVLLKADEIELNMNGYIDYAKDHLMIEGEGMIPKRSKSILQTIGVGEANLGNLLSMGGSNSSDNSSKNFFSFQMIGPVTDMDRTVQSVKSSFKWIDK